MNLNNELHLIDGTYFILQLQFNDYFIIRLYKWSALINNKKMWIPLTNY